jgi:uncharacterized protein YicC (UPF0701 family)
MTGFGRAEKSAGDWQVLVETKSLNGKQFEINLKLPPKGSRLLRRLPCEHRR